MKIRVFVVVVLRSSFVKEILSWFIFFSRLSWHASNGIRINWLSDSSVHTGVVFSTSCAQLRIIAPALKDTSSGRCAIVFYFSFSLSKALGENNQLCFALSDPLQSQLVPQRLLSAFHKKSSL